MSQGTQDINETLDVKGLMCPMPLVKARQAIMKMDVGHVLRVMATDKGSIKDFQGWSKAAKNVELLDQSEEQDGGKTIYIHLVRRTK